MLQDRFGNVLLDLRSAQETELSHLSEDVALTASLVVVIHRGLVLLGFDSWRKQWEVPGGGLEFGETWREAAQRELFEETGIVDAVLTFAVLADFRLVNPDRLETLAIFRTDLDHSPRLITNSEIEDFRWWNPSDPVTDEMSPLDIAIARHVLSLP
jgi:8-oxo-dGTP diphosphatase